jgi:hypothetical protein
MFRNIVVYAAFYQLCDVLIIGYSCIYLISSHSQNDNCLASYAKQHGHCNGHNANMEAKRRVDRETS